MLFSSTLLVIGALPEFPDNSAVAPARPYYAVPGQADQGGTPMVKMAAAKAAATPFIASAD
jgi:hypothetical protein